MGQYKGRRVETQLFMPLRPALQQGKRNRTTSTADERYATGVHTFRNLTTSVQSGAAQGHAVEDVGEVNAIRRHARIAAVFPAERNARHSSLSGQWRGSAFRTRRPRTAVRLKPTHWPLVGVYGKVSKYRPGSIKRKKYMTSRPSPLSRVSLAYAKPPALTTP